VVPLVAPVCGPDGVVRFTVIAAAASVPGDTMMATGVVPAGGVVLVVTAGGLVWGLAGFATTVAGTLTWAGFAAAEMAADVVVNVAVNTAAGVAAEVAGTG